MSADASATGPRRNIRIGKYEVLSHIASGGMGAVYKALDTESGQEVALKVLSPEMAAKPAMVERFRREAKHAAKLRHENVVSLHEFGEAQHTYYLVMEFVDGIDLFEYVSRKGPLDPDEALEIIRQGCLALDHAYQQGVVHRDVKPSNFLVTRQGDRLIVKLTDLGLAREASNQEFRVTKAGTTIGTLDYMSPEQARDSGLADTRSDLYSLGCTWYHLLTGHAPFPKGGLGERLHRIMHEEPADVRRFNPRVSEEMASVLRRLMAKQPSQRYQTPADLLRELDALKRGESLLTPRQALEKLALEADEPDEPLPKKQRVRDGRRPPQSARARPPAEATIGKSNAEAPTKIGKSTAEMPIDDNGETNTTYLWYFFGGAAAIIFLVTLAVILTPRRARRDSTIAEQQKTVVQTAQPDRHEQLDQPAGKPDLPSPSPAPPPKPNTNPKPDEGAENIVPPKKPKWPSLYRPSKPIDFAALRSEIEVPWVTKPAVSATVELTVGRLPLSPASPAAPGGVAAGGKTYRSLAAACSAIPAGATGIIELRDNGPFFDVPVSLADRSLVIRAAKGYQPLLVWDVPRMLEELRRSRDRREAATANPLVFLAVKHGNLTLQGVHLAFKWPDAPSEKAAVLAVEDGDLTIRSCTFSVAGKPRDGVTLVRFSPTRPESGHCRFEHCYVRGAKLSVLDAQAPGAQVLFENCLFIGDDAPLLQARIANDRPTRFRAVRSTMICGKEFLALRPANETERDPAFDWLGWDVLLSRKEPEFGGELLHLDGKINPKNLHWQAINCLYAGWGSLAAGDVTVPATDLAAWRRLWDNTEGDEVLGDPWPTAVFPEAAEVPSSTYRTAGSLVAFAASTDPDQPLGCDLDRLPPARDNWLSLTFDRYPVQAPAVPDDTNPPEISAAGDGLFHGAQVDLNQTDLGEYLQTVQKSYRLAPEVVLRLSGDGERLTTPLQIKGSNLVLYFEPPPEKKEGEKKEPLALSPAGRGPAEALIEVEGGNLSIINGNFRFSNTAKARVVPWFIKMRGGDLRLLHTRLEVPPKDSSVAFRGLIEFAGSGDTASDRARSCVINESILASARDAIAVEGIGARLLLAQTLLIASEDAIHLALDSFTGKANVQCVFDHTTVSARGAVLYLPDVKQSVLPVEPVIVQSHDCGFVNLLPGRVPRSSLVRYEGEALAHGLLIWQSENDSFDRRLSFGAVSTANPLPDKPEDRTSWLSLWGSPALRRAQLDLLVVRTLDNERWPLEQRLGGWKAPGANLDKLGLSRKLSIKTR